MPFQLLSWMFWLLGLLDDPDSIVGKTNANVTASNP